VYPKPYFTLDRDALILHDEHLHLPLMRRITFLLSQKSVLYNWFMKRLRVDLKKYKKSLVADVPRHDLVTPNPTITVRLIREIVDLTRGAHARALIVLHPSLREFYEKNDLIDVIRSQLPTDVPVIDMKDEYEKHGLTRRTFRDAFTLDPGGHLNPAGHALAARIIKEKLLTLFPTRAPE
jgi:hypothetical protein